MNSFPSTKVIVLISVILLSGFGFHFSKSLKNKLYQLKYDWSSLKELGSYEIKKIEKLDFGSLILKLDLPLEPNNQKTYSLDGKRKYYFRYAFSETHGNTVYFSGVTWINLQPETINDLRQLSEVDISLKTDKNAIHVLTLGDELLYRNEAKYFRKELFTYGNIAFYGNQKDVFNTAFLDASNPESYHYDSQNIDCIVVFTSKFNQKLYSYLSAFLENPSKKVIIILPPKRISNMANEESGFESSRIKQFKNAEIVNSDELLVDDFMYMNGNELSMEAYKKLAKTISKSINESGKDE